MRVFMLGWEFPPHISGGLGTACYGMTKGLDEIGVEVCFVLPTAVPIDTSSHVKVRTPADIRPVGKTAAIQETTHVFEHVELHKVEAVIQAYGTPGESDELIRKLIAKQMYEASATAPDLDEQAAQMATEAPQGAPAMPSGSFSQGPGGHYAGNLMGQIQRYAALAVNIASNEKFDVIHAHDWMTFPAGLATAAATGKPLVVHIHSTEFDRAGENVNQQVYDIERAGMHGATRVICVSHLTRKIVQKRYGVPSKKVEVVYNAVNLPKSTELEMPPIRSDEKIVLFLGRVTMQKGPEYFLQAAKKVVELFPKVRFIMAGSGDMITQCIKMAADLKIGGHVTFTGFLRGESVDRVFKMADLYVMPSVSEPFGIAPLEALSHNVPVIISKQSGVSEVLTHALKVDFWDVDEIANKILAVLRHPPLQRTLRQHGHIELGKFSWVDSAKQLQKIYEAAIEA